MCQYHPNTPIELAAREESGELLIILGKFTEIPDAVKLEKMTRLMFMTKEWWEANGLEGDYGGGAREQFRRLLSSVSMDSVKREIIA